VYACWSYKSHARFTNAFHTSPSSTVAITLIRLSPHPPQQIDMAFSKKPSATASAPPPQEICDRRPDHLIRALTTLQTTTKDIEALREIHDQAERLIDIFNQCLHGASAVASLTELRDCIRKISTILKPQDVSAHLSNIDTVTGDILAALENLESLMMDSRTLSGVYTLTAFESGSASARLDANVINPLRIGYVGLDQLFHPHHYQAHGSVVFRANGADINVEGDLNSGNYGPSFTEVSYSNVRSQAFASGNDYRGFKGARMIAYAAKLNVKGPISSHNTGDIGDFEANGASISSKTGSLFSHLINNRSKHV
jgi:hypothetical protein